jgi:OOP family OmpA-OmpF porin
LWTREAPRDTEIKLVRSGKRVFAVCAAAAVVLAARRGTAQTASGIALERFNPSERGSDWFVLDSLDLRGTVRPAIGVVGDYGYRPLVLYNADGAIQSSIIRDQLIVHVGASLVLVDRIRLAANLPIAAWQDGQGGTLNGVTYASVSSGKIGDTRLGIDVRLAGTYSSPFSLAVGAQVFLPTGDQDSYLSDGSVRVLPRLQVAGDVGPVAYAASAGYMVHAHEDTFAGYPLGGEIVGAASLGVRVAGRSVLVGAEATGSTVVTQSDAFGALRQTPIEALLGIHFGIGSDWRAAVGAGPGLTRAFGEPEVRALANVEWAPAIRNPSDVTAAQGETGKAPPDRDKDGVPDRDDACPDQPGVKTTDPETNGCPPAPADRDEDGVPDADDACPDVAGVKTDDPKTNGCPPDRDKDGVPDANDACPDQPGVKTSDPKTNGCPVDPDRDKDGIPNEDDACPDAAGPASPDPKANGCPRAFVQGAQIKILDQVRFATGSAAIVPGRQSEDVLGAVLKILLDHPEINALRVEGHTDNQGSAVTNHTLSEQRAASVVRWLVQHGIDASRLSSQGFGFDRPIDTNDTPEGRKNNRRVEFHIEQESKE